MQHLTQEQAYLAMYAFLAKQFSLGCDELGDILGSMSVLPDGRPANPALFTDWQEAISAAISGQVNPNLAIRS